MNGSCGAAVLVAAAALVAPACGGDDDELSRAHPGKHLLPITAFEDRGKPWEFRAYFDGRSCVAFSTPTSGGGECFAQVPGDNPAEASMTDSGGRQALFGLAAPNVAAVRYRTRYGPAIAETRRVPGFRLRFFLAMHETGVARDVLNPVAVDARGQRVGAQP
jgi:hypothetical protein